MVYVTVILDGIGLSLASVSVYPSVFRVAKLAIYLYTTEYNITNFYCNKCTTELYTQEILEEH